MNKKPKVLATICARGGSKGLPGKNIKKLKGKPLLAYSVDCANKCSIIGRTILSTDNNQIRSVAKSLGVDTIRRPSNLATDESPKIDSILHATEYVENKQNFYPDYIVDLDVGVPLRKPEDITNCVTILVENPKLDGVVTIYESERNPYFNMIEFSGSEIKLVKNAKKGILSRQEAPEVFSVSPAVFVWRRKSMSIKHLYQGKWGAHIIPRRRAIDIDTKFDFDLVTWLMVNEKKLTNE